MVWGVGAVNLTLATGLWLPGTVLTEHVGNDLSEMGAAWLLPPLQKMGGVRLPLSNI